MFEVTILHNVVRGQFDDLFNSVVYWEHFSIVARKGQQVYLHFHLFDDWDKAQQVVQRIRGLKDFTPENKPGIWHPILDTTPIQPRWKKKIDARYLDLDKQSRRANLTQEDKK